MSSSLIAIFDTTLRDGEQSPGASMNVNDKLRMADALVAMNVDVIEAGFPNSSQSDFDGVVAVAKRVGDRARVAALARCKEQDVTKAVEAVKHAAKARVHVFCATSGIHREFKLRLSVDEIIELARNHVALAKQLLTESGHPDFDIEFSPEDASRTELEVLVRVLRAAIEAGATILNIPDTVGFADPWEYGDLFRHLRQAMPEIDERGIILSAHCHNDLGMAVANSLAAVRNGARQVECTLAGIGERTGNAQLEAFVMALKLKTDFTTQINTREFGLAVETLRHVTGLEFSRSQPVTGQNAFAHESGIHQDGMLKDARTYEIISPEEVGWKHTSLVLGKHSGKGGVKDALTRLGITVEETELAILVEQVKQLATAKREVYDSDLLALVGELRGKPARSGWRLKSFRLHDKSGDKYRATVSLLTPGGEEESGEGEGDGCFDAMFDAIREIVDADAVEESCLHGYKVRNVTVGEDSLAEASITLRHRNEYHHGLAVHTDVVEASLNAYLAALNRMSLPVAAAT